MSTKLDNKNEVDWREYIHADPSFRAGKPIVTGTQLDAESILRLLAAGWTMEEVFESDPGLTPEAVRAVFALAADVIGEETWSVLPRCRLS